MLFVDSTFSQSLLLLTHIIFYLAAISLHLTHQLILHLGLLSSILYLIFPSFPIQVPPVNYSIFSNSLCLSCFSLPLLSSFLPSILPSFFKLPFFLLFFPTLSPLLNSIEMGFVATKHKITMCAKVWNIVETDFLSTKTLIVKRNLIWRCLTSLKTSLADIPEASIGCEQWLITY